MKSPYQAQSDALQFAIKALNVASQRAADCGEDEDCHLFTRAIDELRSAFNLPV